MCLIDIWMYYHNPLFVLIHHISEVAQYKIVDHTYSPNTVMCRAVKFTRVNWTVSIGEFTIDFHCVLILREISERGGRCIDWIADYRKCARFHDVIGTQCCQLKSNTQLVNHKQLIDGHEYNNDTLGYE